jgi:hypothetical protein
MPLRVASVNMVQQDNDKLRSKKISLHADLHKHRTCNLGDQDGSFIVKNAYGQLKVQIKEGQNYASLRTGPTTWKVIRSTDRQLTTLLPIFERTRIIKWNDNGLLQCNCGYIERWGMPCRHMAHVVIMYSHDENCSFTHHDVDIRWWTVNAMLVFDADSTNQFAQDIQFNLQRIGLLQQRQYPMVDKIKDFCGVDYRYGSNSNDRFRSLNVVDAIALFSFTNSRILNYSDTNVNTNCIGITNTIYLGDDSSENSFFPDLDDEDTTGNCNISAPSCITQQHLISSELVSRKKCKPMNPHEIFGPLYKEISDASIGDTLDELSTTKSILQSIINIAKSRRAAKTKTIKGKMVTCTVGNASKEHFRFKNKKQKFFG